MCNGSTADSDSVCLGSSPRSPVRKKTKSKDLVFFQRCLPVRASDGAFDSDVHCVSDVSPCGEVGKHHITLRQRRNTSLWQSHNITATTPQHHSQRFAPKFSSNTLQLPRFYDILIPERRWGYERHIFKRRSNICNDHKSY